MAEFYDDPITEADSRPPVRNGDLIPLEIPDADDPDGDPIPLNEGTLADLEALPSDEPIPPIPLSAPLNLNGSVYFQVLLHHWITQEEIRLLRWDAEYESWGDFGIGGNYGYSSASSWWCDEPWSPELGESVYFPPFKGDNDRSGLPDAMQDWNIVYPAWAWGGGVTFPDPPTVENEVLDRASNYSEFNRWGRLCQWTVDHPFGDGKVRFTKPGPAPYWCEHGDLYQHIWYENQEQHVEYLPTYWYETNGYIDPDHAMVWLRDLYVHLAIIYKDTTPRTPGIIPQLTGLGLIVVLPLLGAAAGAAAAAASGGGGGAAGGRKSKRKL